MKEFSYIIHFSEAPLSTPLNEECAESDGYECAPILSQSSLSVEQIDRILQGDILEAVSAEDKHRVKGVAIVQYSASPEQAQCFRISRDNMQQLAHLNGFLWYATCTHKWRQSKHKLRSFYVVSFSDASAPAPPAPGKAPRFSQLKFKGKSYYIIGENGSYDALQHFFSILQPEAATPDSPAAWCRVDYFTTHPWVDFNLDPEYVSMFARLERDIFISIHQNMATDDAALATIIHHSPTRRYINKSKR